VQSPWHFQVWQKPVPVTWDFLCHFEPGHYAVKRKDRERGSDNGRYGNLRRAWSRETGLPATNLSSRSRSTPVDFWPAWNDYFTSRPRNGGRDPLFAGDAGRILLDHQHFALT
jgi:hypothetical protein